MLSKCNRRCCIGDAAWFSGRLRRFPVVTWRPLRSQKYFRDEGQDMFESHQNTIRYKWDPETSTGYQLRFDAEGAAKGGHYCFHVEDWNCRTVTNEWPCQDLTEALEVLNHFFTVDVQQERERLSAWLPAEYRAAA